MILSRDLFKNDFQVKKRYRDVFNTRSNDIAFSTYGAKNPNVYNSGVDKPLVGWEAKLYRNGSMSTFKRRENNENKEIERTPTVLMRQSLSVTKNFDGGSTRCVSTLHSTQLRK